MTFTKFHALLGLGQSFKMKIVLLPSSFASPLSTIKLKRTVIAWSVKLLATDDPLGSVPCKNFVQWIMRDKGAQVLSSVLTAPTSQYMCRHRDDQLGWTPAGPR
jgi:hypothetical protein